MGIMGLFYFYFGWDLRNLSAESSSLVSTSLAHSGNDEDSKDSGIISLFFGWVLRNLRAESSSKTLASLTQSGDDEDSEDSVTPLAVGPWFRRNFISCGYGLD